MPSKREVDIPDALDIALQGINFSSPTVDIDIPTPCIEDDRKIQSFTQSLPEPEETELQLLMSSKPVVLQGFLFSMHFSGDDLLKLQVNNLDDSHFNEMKDWLEDTMLEIDKSHTERHNSGASSWEGSGTRLKDFVDTGEAENTPDRSRSIKIRMFPRSFSNSLARIKEDLVYERLRKCISITTYSSGRFKQMIFVLPFSKATEMVTKIAEANVKVDAVNAEIKEYVQSKDYTKLHEILENYKLEKLADERSWKIPHIRYELQPFNLDTKAVMDIMKVGNKNVKEELKEKYNAGLKEIEATLNEKNKTMSTQIMQVFKSEIDKQVGQIVARAKMETKTAAETSESLKQELDDLKEKATSIGMEALAGTVIDPLTALIDNPSKAAELFGVSVMSDLQYEVDDRIVAFLRTQATGVEDAKL